MYVRMLAKFYTVNLFSDLGQSFSVRAHVPVNFFFFFQWLG